MLKQTINLFLEKVYNLVLGIITEIFLYVPIYIIFIVAFKYTALSIDSKFSNEQFKIIIGAIGIAATLSGLSFRASSASSDQDKRIIYYNQGLRLFHATLLFIIGISLNYIYYEMAPFRIFSSAELANYYINLVFKYIYVICGNGLFYFGLMYVAGAFMVINKLLFKEKLLP